MNTTYQTPERLGNRGAAHLYSLTVCPLATMDWTQRKTIEVDARNSTQACAIARRAGYYAGDCNMIG
jgi:hypothetical protein